MHSTNADCSMISTFSEYNLYCSKMLNQSKKECQVARKLLPYYSNYVDRYSSVLAGLLGLYRIEVGRHGPVYLLALRDVVPEGQTVSRIFDIKGSIVGRRSSSGGLVRPVLSRLSM